MALDVPFTWYLQTNKTSDLGSTVWAQAVAAGHELGNHSHSHQQTGTGGDIDMATQLIESMFDVTVYTMAAPYGDTSYSTIAETRFLINRGVNNANIAAGNIGGRFNLPCYIPNDDAPKGDMDTQIAATRTAGAWRTVLVHGFNGGSDGAYNSVALDAFVDHVNATKDLGDLWLDTVVDVGAYWIGQATIEAVTPTTAGSDQTWTWTLPDHFPPGKYVRVTVTGGTLKQNGTALPWDANGYYEVALDAESMTLSP
jgi:hypothetical protein